MHTVKEAITKVIILICIVVSPVGAGQHISLTDQEVAWIGNKIFYNECGGKDKHLIAWNDGEDFISLGIGHFIWYPENKMGPFDESFPSLLKFVKGSGREAPGWLKGPEDPRCPWQTKEDFLQDLNSPRVDELRTFLMATKDQQLLFIVNRLKTALPKILQAAPEKSRSRIEQQFYRLAATSAGIYALVDYVNFSGEGVLATERYKGQGWGLLQVLERMNGIDEGAQAIREFTEAAEETLAERVKNSPPERSEQKWMRGWRARLHTYLDSIENIPG